MSQVFEVELTRADYAVGLAAVVGELAKVDKARGPQLFARLGVPVAAFMIVAFAFPHSLPGLVAAGLLIWIGDWAVRAAFTTQTLGVSFDPATHASTRVEFSDDGFVETGALRTRRWTWDAVRQVHLSPGHVILELKGWDMIVLPDRLWPTPEDRGAFLAQLDARRVSGHTRAAIPSTGEAMSRVLLIEPVLLARISLAVAAFQIIFESRLRFDQGMDRGGALTALGAGLLGGAILWWLSGKAFERLAAHSATLALRTAWGLLLLLAAAFVLWFLRLL